MNTKNEPIRIGRISRAVERGLRISLTGDVTVYLPSNEADTLAKAHPNTYLRLIEGITEIIRSPDFVHFDAEQRQMNFIRFYDKGMRFIAMTVRIKHRGRPSRWQYEAITKADVTPSFLEGSNGKCFRPIYKRVAEPRERGKISACEKAGCLES